MILLYVIGIPLGMYALLYINQQFITGYHSDGACVDVAEEVT